MRHRGALTTARRAVLRTCTNRFAARPPERILEVMRVALLSILAGTLVVAGVAGAQPLTKPALRLVDRDPIVVRGTSFKPRERIVVTLTIGESDSRRVRIATPQGAFTARFDGIHLAPCSGATLGATGGRSEVVRLKIGLRECPAPALDP